MNFFFCSYDEAANGIKLYIDEGNEIGYSFGSYEGYKYDKVEK